MDIEIIEISPEKRKPKPVDETKLGFGKVFTDHFFTMQYSEGCGWHDAAIEPYRPLSLDPTAMCLHYAQEIFEGMKAYRGKNGAIYLFRPADNARRMNMSARRMCMPEIDVDFFLEAVKKLALLEKEWIPHGAGASLYIRPTMIATEAALGVHPSREYLFFIVVGPVGAYYPEGFGPTKIYVSEEYVRSVRGGTGSCKAAGNYAASLYASRIASDMGYTQVLWLDAIERKYVEEVGTSNVFFLIADELITPPLTGGAILAGITRDSVIQMAKSWGIAITERQLAMDEILEASAQGRLQEAFASGTAAIVSPIGHFFYKGREHAVNGGKTGHLTERLYNEILQIQYGEKEDPFGWRVRISG
jgi:branched-chain amino acid aminotransferase